MHWERHRPEQTTLYGLVQQHVQTFFIQAEEVTDVNERLPSSPTGRLVCRTAAPAVGFSKY